jgi:hypothetical protein
VTIYKTGRYWYVLNKKIPIFEIYFTKKNNKITYTIFRGNSENVWIYTRWSTSSFT